MGMPPEKSKISVRHSWAKSVLSPDDLDCVDRALYGVQRVSLLLPLADDECGGLDAGSRQKRDMLVETATELLAPALAELVAAKRSLNARHEAALKGSRSRQ
jgi:hypothetical protein